MNTTGSSTGRTGIVACLDLEPFHQLCAELGRWRIDVPVWFHPAFRCFSVSPIFYWSHRKVDRYIERSALPQNPTVLLGCSGECWCGAYKSRADFEALLDVHPEIFDKLVGVEKAQRGRYTFLYENGQRVPLASLRRKRKQV